MSTWRIRSDPMNFGPVSEDGQSGLYVRIFGHGMPTMTAEELRDLRGRVVITQLAEEFTCDKSEFRWEGSTLWAEPGIWVRHADELIHEDLAEAIRMLSRWAIRRQSPPYRPLTDDEYLAAMKSAGRP